MPYQIMKYENISELKHTPRVSSTAILFGSLSGGLTHSLVHIIVDNSTKRLCGAKKARKNERLLSSFDYNHDLSALLFCMKIKFYDNFNCIIYESFMLLCALFSFSSFKHYKNKFNSRQCWLNFCA